MPIMDADYMLRKNMSRALQLEMKISPLIQTVLDSWIGYKCELAIFGGGTIRNVHILIAKNYVYSISLT